MIDAGLLMLLADADSDVFRIISVEAVVSCSLLVVEGPEKLRPLFAANRAAASRLALSSSSSSLRTRSSSLSMSESEGTRSSFKVGAEGCDLSRPNGDGSPIELNAANDRLDDCDVLDRVLDRSSRGGPFPFELLVVPLLRSSGPPLVVVRFIANSSSSGTASSSPSLGNKSPLDLNESDVSPERSEERRVGKECPV